MQFTKLIFVFLFCCAACSSKKGGSGKDEAPVVDIPFDKAKWNIKDKDGSHYVYRKQMVNNLVKHYKWAGITKDSLIRMLGQPDGYEEAENLLMYTYESKPMVFGIGTAIESVVFELAPDSTVKRARFNDGGWD